MKTPTSPNSPKNHARRSAFSSVLLGLIMVLSVSCRSVEKKPAVPGFSFKVSEKFREIFPALKPEYTLAEVQEFFVSFSKQGDEACKMIHGRIKRDKDAMRAFSPLLWTPNFKSHLSDIVGGCFNFYTMNDHGVNKAFDRVHEMYPNTTKDCYTVGFMQLYFIHTKLNCNKITAIDIDWRILHLHLQVLSKYFNKEPLIVKNLDVRWSTRYAEKAAIRPYETNVTVESFCYWPITKDCKIAFEKFPEQFDKIKQIEMQLSFLHDMRMQPTSEMSVVHVSNAIDPAYTSKAEMQMILNAIAAVPDKNHRTVIVYHGGGTAQFALYEISKDESGAQVISTKCRDQLAWSQHYKTNQGVPYTTHLDKMSRDKSPKVCSGARW